MSTAIKVEGHAQATWRTDPTKNGSSGSIGDIGTHASQLAGFVTSLKLENLSADLATFVDGRALDNNAHAIMRYEGGAGGLLWFRQVALGNSTGVRLCVFAETGFDKQFQEPPNELIYVPISGRGQLIKRGVADVLEDARLQSWKLQGDLKGYLEAFTNL